MPKSAETTTRVKQGYFIFGPVEGLNYETQTVKGTTGVKGVFKYREGETITFSIGEFILGSAPAKPQITPADLVLEVDGDIRKIKNWKATNIARVLQTFSKDGSGEDGIIISGRAKAVFQKHRYDINLDQDDESLSRDKGLAAFARELKLTVPSGPQSRNRLRRTIMGIIKSTDVQVPMRDGVRLFGDVFRPIKAGKYPVILSFGGYGKAIPRGAIKNHDDFLKCEITEDNYYESNPDKAPWLYFELANPADWVPEGYVVINVDGRGVGRSPGKFQQFSLQESIDFYDAIEWAAKQPWSSGKVGLWGASYYAMDAFNVAQLQPPGLKAMIPIAGDIDSYRDYIFNGGIFNTFNFVAKNSAGEWHGVDWVAIAKTHPFADPAVYGIKGSLCISVDLDKVVTPFWSLAPIEHPPHIHTRGSSEAFIFAAAKHKRFTLMSEPAYRGYPHHQCYTDWFFKDFLAFFDYWLKGKRNGIMKKPPVDLMIRTGWGGFYWQSENEWPVARTQYTKYFLDAAASGWKGDGKRKDFMKLSPVMPGKERKSTYLADVNLGKMVTPDIPAGTPISPGQLASMSSYRVDGDASWSHGVSFISEPAAKDIVIAGYIKLNLWVSSTSSDMDIFASVRVMDENNREVFYQVGQGFGGDYYHVGQSVKGEYFPAALGWLKVSHRKLDAEKTTLYRPFHTHQKKDYQPLKTGEIVPVEVEILPATMLVKKGQRIRLDVQPAHGCGHGRELAYDESYHKGEKNTIYSGPAHQSYLQLPVVPK